MIKGLKKLLLIIAGLVALALGTIGIFLPVLPTTPLIILAAICFSGSSEKLYELLMKNKYFASYVDHYKNQTGIPARVKRNALIFLWFGLGISMVITRDFKITILLFLVGIGVTVHIWSLKTKDTE